MTPADQAGSSGMNAQNRLATYGSLGPGQPNHSVLADLAGTWQRGTVYGRLVEEGWGADLGFPGLVLDPAGAVIKVDLLESALLPEHWVRLDAFEGEGYMRVETIVMIGKAAVQACIYVLADPSYSARAIPPTQK